MKDLPKKIYHGTWEGALKRIRLDREIEPLGELVYLTTTFPQKFGARKLEEDERICFLEVDGQKLVPERVYPDMDFVEQAICEPMGIPVVTSVILDHQSLRNKSLAALGAIAYRGPIPFSLVSRICVIDLCKRPGIAELFNIVVSPDVFAEQGEFYRRLVSWCFGDLAVLPIITESEQSGFETHNGRLSIGGVDDYFEFWERECDNRNGIEVEELIR